MTTLEELVKTRKTSLEEALKIFDELPPVSIEFMIGRWKKQEITTGHPMEATLKYSGWYGKLFLNSEEVHPLLFFANHKTKLYAINPKYVPFYLKLPTLKSLGKLLELFKGLLQTKKAKARVRMMEYRGKVTATIIYDHKPIFDYFARIDENTVLGIMDLKKAKPYFWIMERDDHTPYKLDF